MPVRRFRHRWPAAACLACLLIAQPAFAQIGARPERELGKVPLTGPLTPVPPTPQTDIPRYKPHCRYRTERYYHPVEGWISRHVEVCD